MGRRFRRLELDSPDVVIPVELKVTELMNDLLPDSRSWYNPGSSVVHSLYGDCGTLLALPRVSL